MAVLHKLARYRDISTLGSGGMATVVLAEDTLLGREVALKRMHTAADPSGASRLRREALVGASVSHPNLVSIYDVVTTDEGDVVIVMEYVEGENLRDALRRRGRLPVEESLDILQGVAGGLDAIHEHGVVHRDVKPANILLGPNGTVKLADLGIAAAPDRTRITTVGTVLGSFGYMAPEQIEDGPVTPAIDVYALATVAYELLSGAQAHGESTPIAVAHAIATQPPPDLRRAWPQAPAAAAEVLARAMAREPGRRPRSASELIARLRAALSEQDTRRTVVADRPARAAAAVPLAAAGGAVAGMGAEEAEAAARSARTAPRRSATPPSDLPGSRQASRWLVPLGLLVAALGVIAVVLLASGGSSPAPTPTSASHTSSAPARTTATHTGTSSAPPAHSPTTTASTRSTPSSTATSSTPSTSTPTSSSPTSSTPGAPAPTGGAGSPTAAVSTFYELAAAHQFSQAWALADPVFRNQLGGYQSFVNGQSGDRKIIFHTDQVVSQSGHDATVAIRTTSVREGGAQQCAGTVRLQNESAGSWLLHDISINCT